MSKRRQAVRLRDREGSPAPHKVNPHPYYPFPHPPQQSFNRKEGIKCIHCGMFDGGPLHMVIVRSRPVW